MPLRLFAPRYWPTWAALGILRALSLLPFSWLVMSGRALGAILRRLPVASLGLALLETGFAWWSSAARVQKIVHVEGVENLQAALERGRGVILLTAHFIPLELGGRILAAIAPINILYRQPKNEVLAHFLAQCRCAHGHPIPRDDIRSLITALKKNECVWYAPDQSYRKKGAQRARLFDIPAATNTLTSRLARMTGATVLPYFFERLPGSRGYRAVIHPPSGSLPRDSPGTLAYRLQSKYFTLQS
jgi:Kdo2-lipid IVA lauroyltransferase/acyltransferase